MEFQTVANAGQFCGSLSRMILGLVLAFLLMIVVAIAHVVLKPSEGFDDVPLSAFVPSVTPGGYDADSKLSPAAAMNMGAEKLIVSAALPAMDLKEAESNWGKMTSETCYKTDIGESLKKTRNYLQRTNNYEHVHPDSCSAPNHEFVGTFYTPFNGVGNRPASGTKYPASTQCGPRDAV